MSNEKIFNDLVSFVEIIKKNKDIAEISLKVKTIESLVIKKKFRSLKLNFLPVYKEILNFLRNNQDSSNSIVLDVCCGLGFFTQLIGNIYQNVKGFDLNKSFLEFAKKHAVGRNGNKVDYYFHDINNDLNSANYYMINSIFGINTADKPENVVKNFIHNNPKYIVLFDGNSTSIYSLVCKKVFRQKNYGINFKFIKKTLKNNNFEILLERNIHTIPSVLIDLKYFGIFFAALNVFLRRFDLFAASKFIIAKNNNNNYKRHKR